MPRACSSRSAAVAGAYLLAAQEAATVEEAVARLRKVRPSIIIRPEAMEALRGFQQSAAQPARVFVARRSADRTGPLRHPV
jgi:protein-tyrosine phosphatase